MVYEVIEYCKRCYREIEECGCTCDKCDDWLHDCECENPDNNLLTED